MPKIEEIFKLYYRPLCIYAIGILKDVNSAEDVVMDSYVRFWNRQKDIQIDDIKNYLYTTVRNACYDLNRKKQKMPFTVGLNLVENEINQKENEKISEIAANLWTAIDTLPHQCRKIFLMSKRDGMKYSEIAEELDVSIKTVEAQISKAYKVLRGKTKHIYTFFCSLFV